jgi:carboxypeptidase family protein
MTKARVLSILIATFAVLLLVASVFGQETTAGLQGTVKDSTGAVVANARVVLTGASLTGNKSGDTDGSGYYRFANVPPGSYTVTVTAQGFTVLKREGLVLEVGHLPTVDFALQVGASETVVEVSGAAPAVDVTTNVTQTNITQDVVQDVPHGRSFQSVIQFAPSARNEPLEGSTAMGNGTGGNAPGSTSNGSDHGFSVAGGSDAENSYLVEGQETANLIGGYSKTNVPFDFIQEVQVKSSGIEAEHGGALGGVVNVIMKKGSNDYHGSAFMQFENDGMDGGPQAFSRYDPQGNFLAPGAPGNPSNGYLDTPSQNYQPVRAKTSDVFPGFTFGGPILKDRIFGFVGFNPEWNDEERHVNFGPTNGGILPFSRNTQTYYTTARVDASLTQKIRAYGSWLYQYQRQSGVNLPRSDSTTGFANADTGCNGAFTPANSTCSGTAPSAFAHSVGYTAPNVTTNVGADITITPHIVATTRFGYYFENYADFGYPRNNTLLIWENNGVGINDLNGVPMPTSLQHSALYANDAFSQNFTTRNANKAIQYDADLAWFKSGWKGTHNFKFGYQLNRLHNDILQSFNEPNVQVFPGEQGNFTPQSQFGAANCAAIQAQNGYVDPKTGAPICVGRYGEINVNDFGTGGVVTSFNHGLFAQDSWTLGRGITINAGIRLDKEYLPASSNAGLPTNPIAFSWGDKVAPRIGAAWDVFRDGKMKVFGSYGKFFDIMKLNVAISSFGGQYWGNCEYTLNTANLASIVLAPNSANRYCMGPTTQGANWAGGATPAGLTFIENINNRTFPTTCSTCSLTSTGVVPGLKPFSQHESVFGVDYQLSKTLSFEARWDRRRLDHAIEDSSIIATTGPASGSETFVIGNPGQGTERTFNKFYNFLYPQPANPPPPACSGITCPPQTMIPAARSYDGVEFRLNKSHSDHWFGMVSYTYSKLRGNYTGLTSSDISDGQLGGRSSPNNSRAFDEPYFQWNSFGGSSSGLLPTDRPSTWKGYAYYELPWMKKFTTDFGIFQYLYSGSPMTSYLDEGAGNGGWAVQAWDRGQWVDASRDPASGLVTLMGPRVQRTPWYTQSDFNLQQNYKVSEQKVVSFSATFANLFNQRSVTAYNADITSLAVTNQYIALNSPPTNPTCAFVTQCRIVDGNFFYAAAERPYNVQTQLNNFKASGVSAALNSQYKTPAYYQIARTIRLGVKFTF